jgi:hypothetical protein
MILIPLVEACDTEAERVLAETAQAVLMWETRSFRHDAPENPNHPDYALAEFGSLPLLRAFQALELSRGRGYPEHLVTLADSISERLMNELEARLDIRPDDAF